MKKNIFTRRSFLNNIIKIAGYTTLLAKQTKSFAFTKMFIVGKNNEEAPVMPHGIQIGDVNGQSAVIWSRSDREAKMLLEYDLTKEFLSPKQITGPIATSSSDFTSRIYLKDLPLDETIYIRVAYADKNDSSIRSAYINGSFQTPPSSSLKPVHFIWSGDTAGQGWGINPDFGGMKIYETIRNCQPNFFIHSGDNIYADHPILPEVKAENGKIWKNLVTKEVSKVAETLEEFRGRYKYNLMDKNILKFSSEIPSIWQWDDHEVLNNWSSSKDLREDTRYTEKNISVLAKRARQAFLEYSPMRWIDEADEHRIYRKIAYGPLVDIFVIDMRSYRGPNSYNMQTTESDQTAFLGKKQISWLIDELKQSKAVWKVVAADMPLSLSVPDDYDDVLGTIPRWEAVANADNTAPKGRELEIAGLLSSIKEVRNVLWITADVHYCAAHYYDPGKAQFKDFSPFWEFISGPLNAGTCGSVTLDKTFGPEEVFRLSAETENGSSVSPFAELQFFGEISINPENKVLTVDLKDINNKILFSQAINPHN